MLNQDQWLSSWIDIGPMERVATDNFDIGRKMLLKCSYLWGFAGSLAAHYGALFGGYNGQSVARTLSKEEASYMVHIGQQWSR